MNAEIWNAALTATFSYGGRGDILLWGYEESSRQFEEMKQEEKERAHKIMMRGLREGSLKECPCGCGLQGELCQAQASKVYAENEEIPF